MSQVFQEYSKYYDLLYKDKDYQSETDFIRSLIKKYAPSSKSLLNIGCGTGEHDRRLGKEGYEVTGIDLSEEMIKVANAKISSETCHFELGDARSYRSRRSFDCVTSLFHVLSYQTSNEDFSNFIDTISANLNSGGIAIFDYWYGPAVLNVKPENRIKKMKNGSIEVTRFASTKINYQKNVATVSYDILLKNLQTKEHFNLNEDHPMRYYFLPEIELILKHKNLKLLGHFEWMSTNKPPSEHSWSSYTIIQK